MRNFYALWFLAFLLLSNRNYAQQLGNNTQYIFNQLAINPAYAGIHQSLQLDLNVRDQWTGLEGAPSTQQLSIHGAHQYKPISFGAIIIRDQIGLTSVYDLRFNTAYRIHTSYAGQLSFGIQAGLFSHEVDFSQGDLTDPALNDLSQNFITPTVGAGIMWHSPKYYIGLGVPRILTLDVRSNSEAVFNNERQYHISAGIVHKINRNLRIKPGVLLKLTESGQYQFDVNATFLLDNIWWLGVTYSHDNSLNGLVSFRINEQMQIGYSYDHPLEKSLNGSHEIQISYRFKRQKYERLSPIYF